MDFFNSLFTINAAFQSLGGWLAGPMKFFSFLGSEDFFLLALPLVYWCLDAALELLEQNDVGVELLDERFGGTVIREAGPMKHGTTIIAFVQDPDGYKIELIQKRA